MFDINSGTREGGVESPWLYVLFVADLIEKINEIELSEDPIFIGNRKVRVLQFADDLVFLARSESDLNALLARWSSYCSLNHQETSLSKTVIAIFTNENDEDLQIQDGVATIGKDGNFKFVYRDHELTVIEFFVYLGVMFDIYRGPEASWEMRDEKARKALGALTQALKSVPELPYSRAAEMMEAIVGGAYLFGSELWALFIDRRTAHINRKYVSWLLGLGRVREVRLTGWLPIKDLDIKAEATVVRMICEARSPGNLLNYALHQLYLNWRTSRGRDKRLCWWGRMRSMLRRIWPQCDLHFHGEYLISTGNAFDLQNPPLSRARYIEETTKVRWKTRQNALLARQTTDHQQEFIFVQPLS